MISSWAWPRLAGPRRQPGRKPYDRCGPNAYDGSSAAASAHDPVVGIATSSGATTPVRPKTLRPPRSKTARADAVRSPGSTQLGQFSLLVRAKTVGLRQQLSPSCRNRRVLRCAYDQSTAFRPRFAMPVRPSPQNPYEDISAVSTIRAKSVTARVRFGGFAVSRFHRPAFWQEKRPNLGKTGKTTEPLHPY